MTTTAEHAAVSPTAPAPAGPEVRALTGLRIVAAAWVVLFHFHFTALPGVALVVAALGPVVTSGALGVDLFFVLSGFVIAYTYLEKLGPRMTALETGKFVWARACRIWPAYALVFHMFGIWLVARAVYGSDPDIAFQAVQPELGIGEWVQQLFMVQLWDSPYFDGVSWVGSTWSISAEWLAYLLFPVAAVGFHRMRNLPFVVLAGGAVALMAPIALSYLAIGSPYFPFSWLVRILCGFGGGILTYLAVRRLRRDRCTRARASAVATATPLMMVAGLVAGELVGPGRGGVVILLFPVLVGALALADRGLASWLSTPAMVRGGRISYALYLIHIPMFEVFWLALRRFGGYQGSSLLVADGWVAHLLGLAVLVGTVPAAYLLYRWVEEPARIAMKKVPELLHVPTPPVPVAPRQRSATSSPPAAAPVPYGPITRPLAALPPVLPSPGVPLDTDSARRDPQTSELPAVVALDAEKAVALSEAGSWPEPAPVYALLQRPIPNETARLDPPTHALPLVAATEQDPAWAGAVMRQTAAGPAPVWPGAVEPPPLPADLPVPGVPTAYDPAPAVPEVPAGMPMLPVVRPATGGGAIERVQAARNAELRSPHPELAEQLVAAGLGKGRHRVRNSRPHGAPHIAGQRGPDRWGRSR